MKLMTYNILDGAAHTLSEVIEVVREESPDYLTLNEANTFSKDGNKILKEFAERTNLPYFEISLSGKDDYHVAVFSKIPFKSTKKLHPLDRACVVTLIESEFGEISIAGFHLTPFEEDLRLPEIDLILNFQKQYTNSVLMGDMNSITETDNYDEAIIKHFNKKQIRKFTTNERLRFDVINRIIKSGYADSAVLKEKNKINTVPTEVNIDSTHDRMRLDYIFLSPSLSEHLSSYAVIKNERTNKASDHYPVVAQLS